MAWLNLNLTPCEFLHCGPCGTLVGLNFCCKLFIIMAITRGDSPEATLRIGLFVPSKIEKRGQYIGLVTRQHLEVRNGDELVKKCAKHRKWKNCDCHSIRDLFKLLIFTRYQPNSDYLFNILKAVSAIFTVTLLMTIDNSILQLFHMYAYIGIFRCS